MKALKSYILILLAGAFTLTSCEDYFGDVNVDPDNPVEVNPSVLLPVVQTRMAYTVGGDFTRYMGVFTQHIDGVTRQFAVIQRYNLQPNDVDNAWDNMYTGVIMDSRQMAASASESGWNHYVAAANVMEAWAMMMVTDAWGDVPYSESFQGTDIITPKFDSQESVYNAIFGLLSDATGLFNGDDGGLSLAGADLFYDGDVDQWKKLVNHLTARAHLHLADRDPSRYNNVLTALGGGFESADDDASIQFGTGPTAQAPWFQYINQRSDIEIGDSYVAMMNALNDPRVDVFGVTLVENTSHPYFIPNQNLKLATYFEAKFMEAEALMATNGDPENAYLAAIEGSFADAGVDGYDAYIAQDAVVPSGGVTMNEIMTQKYIAMFGNIPESFSDWRRTGIPALDPNTGTEVPRRFLYPNNEQLSNPNTPAPGSVTLFTPVWWDAE